MKQIIITTTIVDVQENKTKAHSMTVEVSDSGKVETIDGKKFDPKDYCGWHCANACGTDNWYDPCYQACLVCCWKGGCKKLIAKLAAATKESSKRR